MSNVYDPAANVVSVIFADFADTSDVTKGKAFDVLFLQGMIKHHEGAIEMAQEVATSMNKDVANLSAAIIQAQEHEIAKMNELLLKS